MAQAEAAQPEEIARAHARLLADKDIQFDLAVTPRTEAPDWLKAFGRFIAEYFWLIEIVFWVLVATAVAALAAFLVMRFTGAEWPWRRRRGDEKGLEDWRPAEAPARALLREADALAADGRFSEAAHLLLFRSIEEIESRRPKLVRLALTSRDIAGAETIPEGPRGAFTSIVTSVERSLFGGRALGEQDWRRCRAAYEEFALAGAWH